MSEALVTVRMFSLLGAVRAEKGLPKTAEVRVPAEGMTAHDLAVSLQLRPERIEGAIVNHTVYGLDRVVMPGDRVAFVPFGTPGPHRFFLGLFDPDRRAPSASEVRPDSNADGDATTEGA